MTEQRVEVEHSVVMLVAPAVAPAAVVEHVIRLVERGPFVVAQ